MAKRKTKSVVGDTGETRSYTVFFQQESSGIYTAHIPALDIVTEGKSLKEAEAMAKDAIVGWIEAAEELGREIPGDVAVAQVEVGG